MGKLQDDQNALYPPGSPAPPGQTPAAPTPDANAQNAGDSLVDQQNRLHPPPPPSDEDILGSDKWNQHNFWNLPPGVSQGDYWGAEGRKIGSVAGQSAADTALIYGDDMSFGTPGFTGVPGQSPEDYRAAVQAARDRAGAGKYGIDAMAFLMNKPFQALRLGLGGAKLVGTGIKAVAPTAATDTVKAIARRVGNFVEGGTYTGAQSAGHGNDAGTVAMDTAAGGVLSTVLDEGYNAAKNAGPWLRSKIYGTPEGTPADIAAGPPPGSPPRTAEQDLDTQQMNLWRSRTQHDMPPSQGDVGDYATQVYGADPAKWPAALRQLRTNVGGGNNPWLNAAAHFGTQAGSATAQYLGLGVNPEIIAATAPVTKAATDFVLPKLRLGANSAQTGLTNAYPALTGWRPEMTPPNWRY